jgi:diguanylate cyclase (GGDEF)-like protein
MTEPSHPAGDLSAGRRVVVRRGVLLVTLLAAVTATVVVLGPAYLWPLFVFPLVVGAVFFFELGSLLVTGWLGLFFVNLFAFAAAPTPQDVRQAVFGTALFGLAGLLLGRVQRNHHRLQSGLAASSLCDRLTGLYNYGTFVDYLHNEVTKTDRYGGRLTLLMLDLDHFKDFNDRYGHEAGNELLRKVGATLRAVVREADVAARYGGEEFAVLIRGDEAQGFELAERLRRAVEDLSLTLSGGREASATVSVGLASYPGAAVDESELIERADAALYASKHRGRNRVTIATLASRESDEAVSLSA